MLLVRFSRKIRIYTEKRISTFVIIDNCMGKIKMKIDIYSYMGGSLYWSGYHHINESLYLKKILNSNMNFIDIGANQGEFSVLACSIIKNGKVISFEPVNELNNLLTENIELNNFKNIEINNFGLSDNEGLLPIYNSSSSTNNNEGLSSLYKSDSRSNFVQNVQLKKFDDIYFEKLDRLDFIKIDIEGAELYALKGMVKSIKKFKPIILIEVCEEMFVSAGYSLNDMITFLSDLNYKPYKLFRGEIYDYEGDFKGLNNFVFKQSK